MFADSLAKTLAGQGVDVERAGVASAGKTADVLLPELIVLAADAAQGRGAAVLAQLQAAGRTTPTLVISAAEAGGLVPVQAPPHVAYITPAGGVIDCAARVRALLLGLNEHQSSGASLQKLADKVANRAGKPGTSKAAPAQTSPGFPSPLSAAGSKTGAAGAKAPVQPASASHTAATAVKASNEATPTKQTGAVAKQTGQINQAAGPNKVEPPQQPNKTGAARPATTGDDAQRAPSQTQKVAGVSSAATPHKPQQRESPAAVAPSPSIATHEAAEPARSREAAAKAATPNAPRETAQRKPLQSSKPSDTSHAAAPPTTAGTAQRKPLQSSKPSDTSHAAAPPTTAGTAQRKPLQSSKPSDTSHAAAPPTAASASREDAHRNAPLTDKSHEAARAAASPQRKTGEAEKPADASLAAPPSAAAPPLMTPSAAPSGARPQTNKPATPQPQAAMSASPPARAANTGQVTAKPPTITTTGSVPRPLTGQPPAALSGRPHARTIRGVQAAFTTSPAPPREAEQPTLRPTAPGPEEPVVQAVQTVRPGPSKERSQKPANDLEPAPEAEKTAPRIPLRAGKRAAANAQASTGDAAGAALAPQRESPASAHGAPAAPALPDATRASELEIAITMSDPPPARVEPGPQQHARRPQAETAPQTLHAQRKSAQATPAQRLSELDVRQVSDSEVDILPSDRPVALSPKLLPADTNPPPANNNALTASDRAARTHEAATRNAGASMPAQALRPASDTASQATAPTARTAGTIAPNTPPAQTPGAIAHGMPGQAPRNPLEPAPRSHDAAVRITGAIAQSIPAQAPRTPLEPAPRPHDAAVRITGATTQNIRVHAPRNPLEPAAQTSGQFAQSMPAQAPRNPLDPAARPNDAAGRNTGAIAQSMPAQAPRNPLEPAAQTTGQFAQSMPAQAPRHPLEPAPRPNDAAVRNAGATTQNIRVHAPRNPLEPAARANDPARTTGAIAPSMPARAPRYPFEPAPRAAEPAIHPDVARMPSGAPRHPFDPAPRPNDAAHTTASVPRMPSGAPRHPFDPAPQSAEAASASIRSTPSGAPARARQATTSAIKRNTAIRSGRAPADPFQPAAAPERDAPLGLPDIALTPNADVAARPRRGRGAWVLGAVAAIGCSAFWLYQTYDRSAATAPGNAATGALVQTPPLRPLPVEHAAPPALTPEPVAEAPETTAPGAPAASSERRAGSPRRTGESNDVDPTTATGRARGLVDSGSAMLRQGRYGIAEGMYMKALQEVPEYPPAMAELVRVHLARKDGKEAVRWAELLVAKQSNGLHQLLLGDAQALRGNRSAAEAAWTQAAKAGNTTAKQRLSDEEEE